MQKFQNFLCPEQLGLDYAIHVVIVMVCGIITSKINLDTVPPCPVDLNCSVKVQPLIALLPILFAAILVLSRGPVFPCPETSNFPVTLILMLPPLPKPIVVEPIEELCANLISSAWIRNEYEITYLYPLTPLLLKLLYAHKITIHIFWVYCFELREISHSAFK